MASAQENGQFEIKFSDNQESNPMTVFSGHTSIISGGAKATPTGATLEAIPKAYESIVTPTALTGGRVLVYDVSDATDILESEESQWEIPILLYKLNDKGVYEIVTRKTLTQENMTGFTQAGTVDVTVTQGVPQRLAYWEVPRGLFAGIDPNGRVRAYLGDDTA